ncbi:hypothetical protein [Streptomyces flavidovirens]|uniref:hypothetical protein n=1 Tax=Streptomyces flavidovirens TaxID=67298 RepID=UPI0036CCEC29
MTAQPDPQLIADVEAIYHGPTFFKDATKPPPIGTAPPVQQPGRAAMSQQATDVSVLMIAGGVSTVMVGGTTAGLMYVSQYADLGVCIAVFSAPAVLVLALSRLFKAAVQAAPPEIHNHNNGPVQNSTQIVTNTNKLWGKSTTNL